MTFTLDHSNEYKCWINTVPIDVQIQREGNWSSRPVAVAMRGPWTRKIDLSQVVASDQQITAWSIPNKLLNPSGIDAAAVKILKDDVIVESDGTRWTVVWSDQAVVNSHWCCATVPERCST